MPRSTALSVCSSGSMNLWNFWLPSSRNWVIARWLSILAGRIWILSLLDMQWLICIWRCRISSWDSNQDFCSDTIMCGTFCDLSVTGLAMEEVGGDSSFVSMSVRFVWWIGCLLFVFATFLENRWSVFLDCWLRVWFSFPFEFLDLFSGPLTRSCSCNLVGDPLLGQSL